jgi:hypothetical protein
MTMTAPVTHIAVTSIAPVLNRRLAGAIVFELAFAAADGFFGAAGVFERVAFFTGIDGPPSRNAATNRLQQRKCPDQIRIRVR